MLVRTACFLLLLSSPTWAEGFRLFGPPKAKVVATPTPAPAASGTAKPKTAAPKNAKPSPDPTATAKPAPTPATTKPAPAPAATAKTGATPPAKPDTTATDNTPPVVNPAKPAPTRKRSVAKPEELAKAYMPKVKTAIAARWGETVTPLLKDFSAGNVSVAFKLDAEGKVAEFAVTQNTSNAAFAQFCEQYVRETPFEKPPEKALVDGLVEIPFTFWIY